MIGSCIDYSINKTNFAIDVSNNLTLLERKFFNHILYFIEQQGWNNKEYEIPASSFSQLIGNQQNRQTHSKIKTILRRLLTKELRIVNNKYIGYEASTYITYIKIKEKNIIIELSQNLKEHLNLNFVNHLGIKNTVHGYNKLNLNKVNELKSTHSIALYEFFIKIKNQNVTIVDIRNLIEISSCKQCYREFKRFNQSILKPAIEEINKSTNINIEYNLIKYSNEVKQINFCIKFKNEKQQNNKQIILNDIQEVPNVDDTLIIYPMLVQELINIGITTKKAISMHKEDGQRLQSIYDEVKTKYTNKDNKDKTKIIVSMFQNGAYPSFVNSAEKLEQEQKIQIKKIEIEAQNQQILEEVKKQAEKQIIKRNHREIFENELKKEDSQLAQIWKAVTKAIELNIPTSQVRTWFNPAIAKIEDNTLNIVLPNRFKLDFFKNNLLRYVNEALKESTLKINVRVGI